MSHHNLGRAVALLVDAQSGALGAIIDFLQKAQKDPTWIVAMQMCLEKKNPWPTEAKPLSAPTPVLWKPVRGSLNKIRVNLDFDLYIPIISGKPEVWTQNPRKGWVTLERRADGELYRNGSRVTLFLTEGQKTGIVKSLPIRSEVMSQDPLHPNELDALVRAWEQGLQLIPESWKTNTQGRTVYIFFWAVGFSGSDGNLYVRSLHFRVGQWFCGCRRLDADFDPEDPAALSAS